MSTVRLATAGLRVPPNMSRHSEPLPGWQERGADAVLARGYKRALHAHFVISLEAVTAAAMKDKCKYQTA